jgi:predicted GH43/DUF377 family glycosyl hydrolase
MWSLCFSLVVVNCKTSSPDIRGYELIPHYPNLTTIPEPTFDPVEWTKQIHIPGAPGAYNPSLVSYGDGYLLAARYDTMVQGAKPSDADLEDQMVFVKLNRSFEPVGPVSRDFFTGGGEFGTAQDPRLFWWKNKLWAVFNARNQALEGAPRRMAIAEVQEKDGYFSLASGQFFSFRGGFFEKNWPPFIVENELYFIFNTEPHQVIKPDAHGKCTLVATTSVFPWKRGHLRGGTPALPYGENEYISFFHSSKRYRYLNNDWRQIYVMGAYTFSAKPPFAITRYTSKVIDSAGYYDQSNHWKIIFPAGLVLEGNYAYVTMGRNDNQIIVSKISLAAIEKELVPFRGVEIDEEKH